MDTGSTDREAPPVMGLRELTVGPNVKESSLYCTLVLPGHELYCWCSLAAPVLRPLPVCAGSCQGGTDVWFLCWAAEWIFGVWNGRQERTEGTCTMFSLISFKSVHTEAKPKGQESGVTFIYIQTD